jgi:hypothetical protein
MRAHPMRAKAAAMGRAAPLTSGCASGSGSTRPSVPHRARVPECPKIAGPGGPATQHLRARGRQAGALHARPAAWDYGRWPMRAVN